MTCMYLSTHTILLSISFPQQIDSSRERTERVAENLAES